MGSDVMEWNGWEEMFSRFDSTYIVFATMDMKALILIIDVREGYFSQLYYCNRTSPDVRHDS
jgi:hypothetical protein